jgi:hypothetical protein
MPRIARKRVGGMSGDQPVLLGPRVRLRVPADVIGLRRQVSAFLPLGDV